MNNFTKNIIIVCLVLLVFCLLFFRSGCADESGLTEPAGPTVSIEDLTAKHRNDSIAYADKITFLEAENQSLFLNLEDKKKAVAPAVKKRDDIVDRMAGNSGSEYFPRDTTLNWDSLRNANAAADAAFTAVISTQDSVITNQVQQLATKDTFILKQGLSLADMTGVATAYENDSKAWEKKFKVERRRKVFWKIVTGVALGIAVKQSL